MRSPIDESMNTSTQCPPPPTYIKIPSDANDTYQTTETQPSDSNLNIPPTVQLEELHPLLPTTTTPPTTQDIVTTTISHALVVIFYSTLVFLWSNASYDDLMCRRKDSSTDNYLFRLMLIQVRTLGMLKLFQFLMRDARLEWCPCVGEVTWACGVDVVGTMGALMVAMVFTIRCERGCGYL